MFIGYLQLGIQHILDIQGIDHVLFLIALVIMFDLKQWRQVFLLATAFTIGHSLTLVISSYELISVNSQLIELGIALSIALTAIFNLMSYKTGKLPNVSLSYISALVFGFIHGMGFSSFFRTLLGSESIVIPLLGFNIGVEIAQIVIVIATIIFSYLLTSYLKISKKYVIYSVSAIILLMSIRMILERI